VVPQPEPTILRLGSFVIQVKREGRKVFSKAEEICRHWRDRAEVLVMRREAMDEFSYESVPTNRMFYVKTRYVYVGKGLPRPTERFRTFPLKNTTVSS
jgi:hypothetical protein